jgi:hypothetical protein
MPSFHTRCLALTMLILTFFCRLLTSGYGYFHFLCLLSTWFDHSLPCPNLSWLCCCFFYLLCVCFADTCPCLFCFSALGVCILGVPWVYLSLSTVTFAGWAEWILHKGYRCVRRKMIVLCFKDLAWISLRFTAAWYQVWSCFLTVRMFSISAISPSYFHIIVNKQGEMFVNFGFTFSDRICIDADNWNIWQISVPHKILLFQPFFSSVTCFLHVFWWHHPY